MNNDETNQEKREQISAELEARIVAWVMGEASASEAAELGALAAAKPEIAAFKERIERLHRLAAEAVSPDKDPLRLSEARRSKLLRELGATAGGATPAKTGAAPVPELATIQRRQRRERQWMLALAACLTAAVLVSLVAPSGRLSHEAKGRVGLNAEYEEVKDKAVSEMKERRMVTLSAPQDEAAPQVNMPAMAERRVMEARAPALSVEMPAVPQDLVAEAGAQEQPVVPEPQAVQVFDMAKLDQAKPGAAVLNNARNLEPVTSADYYVTETGTGKGTGEAAGADAEKAVALEAFTVSEPEDKMSYKANSTLAGTRVRTDLQDVNASISAVKDQFLQDAGANNAEAGGLPKAGVVGGTFLAGAGSPAGIAGAISGQAGNVGVPATAELTEVSAAKEPVSTFSLHVSDVSFRLAREALARGEAPDPASIRPEEFYNAFDYGDPAPAMSEKVSCHTEQSADPVMQQRNLLRIAMRVPTTGRGAGQPLRLTVLLDTSGSMEREDRAAAVQAAMKVLVSLLGPDDRVTLVGFARRPRLLAEQVPGQKAGTLLDIIARTPPEGGTNLEEAIRLGGELAARQFASGAQNRVVLLTDGAANLGDADPEHLAGLVGALRQKGIAFDACGVGAGIDDSVLEALARRGSGRYYVLDTPEAADEGFARQLAGAFRPAAENVKVQVRFNPARVGNYRLIGFEKHRLNKEDFHNDKVAAAALSGGEAAVALYEVEALPQGDGDLGEVSVRFRDTATGAMVERSWPLPYEPYVPAFDKAAPTMQLAGVAALLAEKLHGGARAESFKLAQLSPVVNALRSRYAHEPKVRELASMYEQTRRMRRE